MFHSDATSSPTLSFDHGTLLLRGADVRQWGQAESARWTWDPRVRAWRCDAIHYAAAREALAAPPAAGGAGAASVGGADGASGAGGRFQDLVPRPARVIWAAVNLPVLRDEQQAAVESWTAGGRRGQIIMPTGTGKTEVALAIMARERTATLVVSPVRDLMYQWHRRILKGLGFDAGILGDGRRNLRPVTVTTYDSAYIHMPAIGADFGLIIFDEEHHLPGPCRREAALMSTAALRLGLTATPERADELDADLDHLVGPVAYRLEIEHVRGRTLADYEVVRIPVALTEDEQATYDRCSRQVRHFVIERRKQKPGYTWQDLCQETGSDAAARTAMRAFHLKKSIEDRSAEKLRVLEDLFRLHAGQATIVFAGSNAMAMDVSRRFLLPTILSHTRKKERLAVLDGFARGELPVLVANRVLDEGVDVPAAKVAVVLGGHASTRQAKQRLGRVLRRTGSAPAVLYEVVCEDTRDVDRSRKRRQSDAFGRTRHRRL